MDESSLHSTRHAILGGVNGLRQRLGESLDAFRAVFANPALRRVELAWATSETAKWLYVIAVAVFAYHEGGAAAVGLVALIRTLPSAVGAPFTALLADRYRREQVMLVATLARALAMGAVAAAVVAGLPAIAVYALTGVVTLASTAFRPAQAALLPSLARTPAELTAANLASSTIASVAAFVGPALGGLLLAATSIEVVAVLTALIFLWAALLVSRIGAPEHEPRAAQPGGGLLREAFAGFGTIAAERGLRVVVSLYAAQTLVAGALQVLIVVAAIQLLDLGDSGVGFLNSAFGIGGLLGALAALALVARQRLASDFALGIVLWGLPLTLIAAWPHPAAALLLLGLIGVGETIVEVAAPTLLQRAVPDHVLARVFGALQSLLIVTFGLGAILAPVLVGALGARGALAATGAVLPVLAVVFWRGLAAVDTAAAAPQREVQLLRAVPIFAPLPQPTVEQLAGELDRIAVARGETVFRQGEPGDRFYLVRDGRVDVSVDGVPRRSLAPGDYFGEIALLRDVPRTATVTAATDVELYALAREPFVAAVTGQIASLEAADAVIGARLGAAAAGKKR